MSLFSIFFTLLQHWYISFHYYCRSQEYNNCEIEVLKAIFIADNSKLNPVNVEISDEVKYELANLVYSRQYDDETFADIEDDYEKAKDSLQFHNSLLDFHAAHSYRESF